MRSFLQQLRQELGARLIELVYTNPEQPSKVSKQLLIFINNLYKALPIL